MNATEDGYPVGEGPIDTLDAIERGAVIGLLSAADKVLATKQLAERQTQALNEILALHQPGCPENTDCMAHNDLCEECAKPYPCPTIRAGRKAGL
ncbi:hypothetical protein [Mycolicibacterium fortuitum]|uniref:hypothetical protein n=1 Tax=Mycolicibacterium fortuitum TaxID=1766 RepID=UPI00148FBF78|nr:hypothetical protein [Mycolicibacterium fortuitum]